VGWMGSTGGGAVCLHGDEALLATSSWVDHDLLGEEVGSDGRFVLIVELAVNVPARGGGGSAGGRDGITRGGRPSSEPHGRLGLRRVRCRCGGGVAHMFMSDVLPTALSPRMITLSRTFLRVEPDMVCSKREGDFGSEKNQHHHIHP